MSDEIKWFAGIILALITAIGSIVVRDRQMTKQIRDGDDRLHERINRIRDEFVRRDDLSAHIAHLERSIDEVRTEQREIRDELRVNSQQILQAIATQKVIRDP